MAVVYSKEELDQVYQFLKDHENSLTGLVRGDLTGLQPLSEEIGRSTASIERMLMRRAQLNFYQVQPEVADVIRRLFNIPQRIAIQSSAAQQRQERRIRRMARHEIAQGGGQEDDEEDSRGGGQEEDQEDAQGGGQEEAQEGARIRLSEVESMECVETARGTHGEGEDERLSQSDHSSFDLNFVPPPSPTTPPPPPPPPPQRLDRAARLRRAQQHMQMNEREEDGSPGRRPNPAPRRSRSEAEIGRQRDRQRRQHRGDRRSRSARTLMVFRNLGATHIDYRN